MPAVFYVAPPMLGFQFQGINVETPNQLFKRVILSVCVLTLLAAAAGYAWYHIPLTPKARALSDAKAMYIIARDAVSVVEESREFIRSGDKNKEGILNGLMEVHNACTKRVPQVEEKYSALLDRFIEYGFSEEIYNMTTPLTSFDELKWGTVINPVSYEEISLNYGYDDHVLNPILLGFIKGDNTVMRDAAIAAWRKKSKERLDREGGILISSLNAYERENNPDRAWLNAAENNSKKYIDLDEGRGGKAINAIVLSADDVNFDDMRTRGIRSAVVVCTSVDMFVGAFDGESRTKRMLEKVDREINAEARRIMTERGELR